MATIRLHRAALAAIHKAHSHEDPTDHEGVRQVMKGISRRHGKWHESADRASWRGRVDLALLSVLRDGLLRRSEAAALTWADVELRDNRSALLQVNRSKTDQEGEGTVLYLGKEAADALKAIRPAQELLDPNTPVFGLSPQQIGRGPGQGVHRLQRPRRHGPGSGQKRSGAAGADDSRPVAELQDAGALHRAPGSGPGRGGQVLRGGVNVKRRYRQTGVRV